MGQLGIFKLNIVYFGEGGSEHACLGESSKAATPELLLGQPSRNPAL